MMPSDGYVTVTRSSSRRHFKTRKEIYVALDGYLGISFARLPRFYNVSHAIHSRVHWQTPNLLNIF